mgnify:FL=1
MIEPRLVVAHGGKVHVLRAHDSQRTACGRAVEFPWLRAVPGAVTEAWCCQGACRDTVMAAA